MLLLTTSVVRSSIETVLAAPPSTTYATSESMAIASAPEPARAICFMTDACDAPDGGDALVGGEDRLVDGEGSTDDGGEDGRVCDGGALDGNGNVVPDGRATTERTGALERC